MGTAASADAWVNQLFLQLFRMRCKPCSQGLLLPGHARAIGTGLPCC